MLRKSVNELLHDEKPWVRAISQKYVPTDLANLGIISMERNHERKIYVDAKICHLSGCASSFWYTNCLGTGNICDQILFVHISDTMLKVSDVWNMESHGVVH